MKYLAIYESNCGAGDTLEEAYEQLRDTYGEVDDDRDCVDFYEASLIKVEFKIVKKEVVSKIKKEGN